MIQESAEGIRKAEETERTQETVTPVFSPYIGIAQNGKHSEMPELTDEQKATLMENLKSSLRDGFIAGKLMSLKRVAPGMIGNGFKSVAADEQ